MDTIPLSLLVLVVCICSTLPSAIPEHKNRVVDKPLSDEDHYKHEEEEDVSEDHNVEYDHEAFLGKEEAKTFDQLTPDESKEKLAIIFKKIDKDADGSVSEEELINWIKHVQNRYVWSDTERQWADHQSENSSLVTLTWEGYKTRTYGHINENEGSEESGYNYRDMMKRDQRRWTRADQNGDKELSKEEFSDFLHPEEADHMKDIIIDETLEDIDKNKDGKITLEEYIGDMWPNANSDEDEPEWVKTEREQFSLYRDKNKDGFMDRDEVKDWILPGDYDHSVAEARHLVHESDGDRDGALSLDEVLDKYDIFVGSQATDFGEALTRHDEF